MRAVFLSENPEHIENVYRSDVRNKLFNSVGLGDKICSKAYVIQNKNEFADTEFVFSTWGMPGFSEAEIKEYLPSLKCVFYAAGTVQYFARPFISSGVKVFSAWAANAVPVAEYATAQIVLANKGYFTTSRCFSKNDRKTALDFKEKYPGNYGSYVGIIGAGMIGKLVIKMLKAYKLDVKVFDPFLPDEKADELGVVKCSLDELFETCFVISNHLANNAQTKGMLCGRLFEKMPEYATFINTGRGAQVVESELCKVLEKRSDLTVILDVTDPEPPQSDSPFYSLDNCILTPHIAGSSGNEVGRMAEYMQIELEKYLNNEKTDYEVTLKMLETMA